MSAAPEEFPAALTALRCRSCGAILGYTPQRKLEFNLWCSEECRDIPLSENNPRDELMVELQAAGVLVSHIAATFGITRQAVTQVLDRRNGKKVRRRKTLAWEPQPKPAPVKRVLTRPRRGRVK